MTSRHRPRVADLQVRYGIGGAGVIEAVRERANDHPDIAAIAGASGVPRAHVQGAATFYADLRPGPQRRVCVGTGCFAAAGGEPAVDGPPAGRAVHCLGCCYAAPAALEEGRLLCGPGLGHEAPPIPWRVAARRPVVLAGLAGAGPEPWSTLGAAEPGRVLAHVEASGLVGRGGAAFPVARKWRTAAQEPAPRVIVANGDEGDAGSFADRLLLERDPDRVLEGMALAALAIGASHGVVYVRSEYPAALAAVAAAVARARSAGHLGARFDVDVVQGAGSYVAGEETALIRSLEGLRASAAVRPPFPAQVGLRGRPTVVNNVETLASVPWIAANGGAAYRALGTASCPGTKLVSLNERFADPGIVEVEFGLPLREIVDGIGGGLRDGRALRALQVGGPLGGFLGPGELDVPLTVADLRAAGVELGHGGLVAIDDRVAPAELLCHLWSFGAQESCGGCVPCRVGTRRGLELATELRRRGPTPALLGAQRHVLQTMGDASLCGFGLGLAPAIGSLLRVFGPELGCA